MGKLMGFLSKSDNYTKAKATLKRVKESFDGFVLSFPDVTSEEIMFIKDKWETLPKKIANGVKIMALSMKGDYKKSFLTEYEPNAYIKPHKHEGEYEIGRIIRGSVTNRLTGDIYAKGDVYKFSPNEVHYLLSSKHGCLVHSVLTVNCDDRLTPLPKSTLNRLKSA